MNAPPRPITRRIASSTNQIKLVGSPPVIPFNPLQNVLILSVSIKVNNVKKLKKFILVTPIPTATNTLLPNKPRIQQMKHKILTPPPIAILLFDLLQNALAPKQIPDNPNMAINEPKQYRIVLINL